MCTCRVIKQGSKSTASYCQSPSIMCAALLLFCCILWFLLSRHPPKRYYPYNLLWFENKGNHSLLMLRLQRFEVEKASWNKFVLLHILRVCMCFKFPLYTSYSCILIFFRNSLFLRNFVQKINYKSSERGFI